MTFPRSSYVALAVSLVLLGGCQSENESSADSQGKTAYQYSTKAVYSPQQQAESYEPAPQGFSPVFTEMVARHGSRSLSSPKYDVLTKLVWEEAQRQGALTPLGQGLGGKVDLVTAANQKLGYGLLWRWARRSTPTSLPGWRRGCRPCSTAASPTASR